MISSINIIMNTITTKDIMDYSYYAIITLILFLALKEIQNTKLSKNKNFQSLISGANTAIAPLLLVFIAIVYYYVSTVI